MKNKIIVIILIAMIILAIGIVIYMKNKGDNMVEDGGVVKDHRLPGYEEVIKSKDIIKFSYDGSDFHVSCELSDNILHVKSKGGNTYNRDGSYFILDYEAKDKSLLTKLQKIMDKYSISKNNGYEHEVAGLPAGLGGSISVEYLSGEKIWKYSNQAPILEEEAINEIYEAFHECAKDNNLDFNSEGSNVELYNDADINYLQGTWVGTHFGNKYKVIFENDNVKIYENDKLVDDTKYIIIEGDIVTNKLKEGVTEPKDRYDYEEFSTISTMKKKNDFTITAYFMKTSYSTGDLLKTEMKS